MEEMRHLKENYYVRPKYDYAASANMEAKENLKIEDNTIVYFVDDVFTVNKKRVKKLLRMMIDEKLDMKWKCEARADHLDDEICELMAEAGCERVKIGFESAFATIVDSNVTTLIAAFLLYSFGVGAIKGFAVTLTIGIISSMYGALVLTKLMIDLWLKYYKPKSLGL